MNEERLNLRYFDAMIWELLTISVLCSVNGEHLTLPSLGSEMFEWNNHMTLGLTNSGIHYMHIKYQLDSKTNYCFFLLTQYH